MSLLALPTTLEPTIAGSNKKTSTNIREITFGNNYTQRTASGMNSVRQTWVLKWFGSIADITELDNFFIERGGWEAFTWVPKRQTTTLKFTCREWSRSFESDSNDGVDTLTATLVQQFDLD